VKNVSGVIDDSRGETPQRYGHHPVVPPLVGAHPGAVDEQYVEALRPVAIADISDAVGRLYTMSSTLHPLDASMPRLIGTALTVKAPPGDNWAVHGAFAIATPGSVIVVDWRGSPEACGAGAAALIPPMQRGLVGIVIDGAWRDVDEVAAIDFPIIGTGVTPFSPPKAETGEINVPISCGGVVVQPGDLVAGDEQGVVVVPRRFIPAVVEEVQARLRHQAAVGGEGDRVGAVSRAYWDEFDARGGLRENQAGEPE
jgi:regulator of RNase E activity RraA